MVQSLDIIDSRFQENPIKKKNLNFFTDDSKFTDDTLMVLPLQGSSRIKKDWIIRKKCYKIHEIFWQQV